MAEVEEAHLGRRIPHLEFTGCGGAQAAANRIEAHIAQVLQGPDAGHRLKTGLQRSTAHLEPLAQLKNAQRAARIALQQLPAAAHQVLAHRRLAPLGMA